MTDSAVGVHLSRLHPRPPAPHLSLTLAGSRPAPALLAPALDHGTPGALDPLGRPLGCSHCLAAPAASHLLLLCVCVCVCAHVRASRSAFPPLTPTSASLVAQSVKNPPAMQETGVPSLGQGRSPGQGNGNPLQYPWLDHPTDRGAWRATVHGVAKSRTGLSD